MPSETDTLFKKAIIEKDWNTVREILKIEGDDRPANDLICTNLKDLIKILSPSEIKTLLPKLGAIDRNLMQSILLDLKINKDFDRIEAVFISSNISNLFNPPLPAVCEILSIAFRDWKIGIRLLQPIYVSKTIDKREQNIIFEESIQDIVVRTYSRFLKQKLDTKAIDDVIQKADPEEYILFKRAILEENAHLNTQEFNLKTQEADSSNVLFKKAIAAKNHKAVIDLLEAHGDARPTNELIIANLASLIAMLDMEEIKNLLPTIGLMRRDFMESILQELYQKGDYPRLHAVFTGSNKANLFNPPLDIVLDIVVHAFMVWEEGMYFLDCLYRFKDIDKRQKNPQSNKSIQDVIVKIYLNLSRTDRQEAMLRQIEHWDPKEAKELIKALFSPGEEVLQYQSPPENNNTTATIEPPIPPLETQEEGTDRSEIIQSYINKLLDLTKKCKKNLEKNKIEKHRVIDALLTTLTDGPQNAKTIDDFFQLFLKEDENGVSNFKILEKDEDYATKSFLAALAIILIIITGILPGLIATAVVCAFTKKTPLSFFKTKSQDFLDDAKAIQDELKPPAP